MIALRPRWAGAPDPSLRHTSGEVRHLRPVIKLLTAEERQKTGLAAKATSSAGAATNRIAVNVIAMLLFTSL